MQRLSDDELREKLRANGYEPGPITPATRVVYERKLERLLKNSKSDSDRQVGQTKGDNSVKVKDEYIPGATSSSFNRSSYLNTTNIDSSGNSLQGDFKNKAINTSFRDSLFGSHSTPQQYPGHTPNAGVRSPLRSVNTDLLYNSPSLSANESQVRSKSSILASTPVKFTSQNVGSISSNSRYSLGLGVNTSRDYEPSANAAELPRSRSLWSQLTSSNRASAVISDETTSGDNIVHRAFPTDNFSDRYRHLSEESFDRSFFSKVYEMSLGNQVPNLILFGVAIFLAVIASSYFLLRDRHSNVGRIADLQKIVCSGAEYNDPRPTPTNFHLNCVKNEDLPVVLKIIHCLYEILSRFAGEHYCGKSVESAKMDVGTAKLLVGRYFSTLSAPPVLPYQVENLWDSVLLVIVEVGQKHLDIIAYNSDGEKSLSPFDVRDLESLRPYIPGICRLRLLIYSILHFLNNLLWLVLILAAVGGFCYIVYRIKQARQSRTKQRAMRVREVVREVSYMLQQQLQHQRSNPTEPPHLPVSIIKERLSHTNSDLEDLWTEIEQYVHLVEGSILVQEWRGIGETWQWQAGSGWQGSAFLGKSHHLPFTTPPTECLKVRNMFTGDSIDASAKRRLKRELLEHIADCGAILHIGLDTQNNQGLVYIKCASPSVAGRVFESIHAHYFDSHLLTVKFLRSSKYHLRFPDARNANTPLKSTDLA